MDKNELVRENVPKICPFCSVTDEVIWTEFRVQFYEECFVDNGKIAERINGEGAEVFCTRCEEHIRQEDWSE